MVKRSAWKNASPICWFEKKIIFQPTLIIPLSINSPIIKPKCFCFEYLFQTIRIEMPLSTNIIVQTETITELEGVHSGRFKVLYHVTPDCAKYEAAEPVIKTSRGIMK